MELGKFSWERLVSGAILFVFFGLIYWLNLGISGLTLLFRRFQIPLSPWPEYFAHLAVSLISGTIIIGSNVIQALTYQLSIHPKLSSILWKMASAKSWLKRNTFQCIIIIIAVFFVHLVGGVILDVIAGNNIPRAATIFSVFLAVLAFSISKIQYYPYVKPISVDIHNITNRHMVWETYQTPGKIRLGSDQYAYRSTEGHKLELIRNDCDIDIAAMARLFFIQPDKMNFKGTRQSLGVGNVRGNILFDIELRINEIYLPDEITEKRLLHLQKIFSNEARGFGFIKDNINPDDLENALAAAGKRINMINSYFVSNKTAVEEDAASILDKITDLTGYRDILAEMRKQIRQTFDDVFGKPSDQLIRFNFNIIEDGTVEKQIIEKIELTRTEANKFLQHIISQFVTAITTRIAQRGGNIDITLVDRVNDLLNNLTGRPTYSNFLESKRQINMLNEEAKKRGLKNLGNNFEELKDE